MATEKTIMAVMRAPHPRLRTAFDTAAFAVHAAFVAAGYVLHATGVPALADDALSISSKDEVGMDKWKDVDDIYAFVYSNPVKCSKKVLVKCVVMDETMLVDVMKEGGSRLHVHLDVGEYVEKDGRDTYLKNLKKLLQILNKEILNKLDASPPSCSTTKNMTSSKYLRPPSFFMICKDDFATKLTLPAVFVEEHRLHLFQLISLQLKTEPGPSWTVKIKKINGIYYFTDGWSKFVRNNNVIKTKILVFHLVAESTLHVSIFGVDSCLELPTPPSPSSSPDDEGEDSEQTLDDGEGEGEGEMDLRFVKKLKIYNFNTQRMEIPKRFVLRSRIATNNNVFLENARGMRWPVTVKDRNREMYSFSRGWVDFLTDNELECETILMFRYVGDNVVKVVVMKKEAGERLLEKAGKGGFLKS